MLEPLGRLVQRDFEHNRRTELPHRSGDHRCDRGHPQSTPSAQALSAYAIRLRTAARNVSAKLQIPDLYRQCAHLPIQLEFDAEFPLQICRDTDEGQLGILARAAC